MSLTYRKIYSTLKEHYIPKSISTGSVNEKLRKLLKTNSDDRDKLSRIIFSIIYLSTKEDSMKFVSWKVNGEYISIDLNKQDTRLLGLLDLFVEFQEKKFWER